MAEAPHPRPGTDHLRRANRVIIRIGANDVTDGLGMTFEELRDGRVGDADRVDSPDGPAP